MERPQDHDHLFKAGIYLGSDMGVSLRDAIHDFVQCPFILSENI